MIIGSKSPRAGLTPAFAGYLCELCGLDLEPEHEPIQSGAEWLCGACFDDALNDTERAEYDHWLRFGLNYEHTRVERKN